MRRRPVELSAGLGYFARMGPRALIACILPLALVLAGSAAEAQRTRAQPRQQVLRFSKTPITAVIGRVSAITGQPFIFDPSLTGSITIQVPEPVDREEALQILNTALLMNGLLTVEVEGGYRKIVKVDTFAENAPLLDGEPRVKAGEMVTTLVHLESADPTEASSMLQPLIGNNGVAIPYPATRSVILAATEARLHRLLGILRDIDSASELELAVMNLRFREADVVAEMIEDAFPLREGEVGRRKIIPASPDNSLLVQATPRRMAEIREFVRQLDVPPRSGGELHVVPILYTDSDRLATTLNNLRRSGRQESGDASQLDPLAFRDYSVVVHPASRSLLIQADPATFRLLAEVIAKIDREEPRVSVEVIIFEVQLNKSYELGVDWIVPVTNPRAPDDLTVVVASQNSSASVLGTAAGVQQPGVVARFVGTSVLIPIVDAAGGIVTTLGLPAAHLVAQESEARLEVLQRPHLLLINGEDQEISVGNNIPVLVGARGDAANNNPLQTSQIVERHDVGVRLRIGATVGQEGPVRLELELELSQLTASLAGDVTQVGPTIQERRLNATVYLSDGESAVLGGLVSPRMVRGQSSVPYLSQVPAIGSLFSSVREVERDVHLMLAVQASVLKTRAEDQLETIRRRSAFERSIAGLEGLRAVTDAPYALLLSSHSTRERAEADARSFAEGAYRAEIVAWSWENQPRYDVYLTGFTQIADASEASERVRAAGWEPRVVVVTSGLSN